MTDPVGGENDPPVSGLAYLDGLVYLARPRNRSLLVWNPEADCVVTRLKVDFPLSGGLTGAGDLGLLFDSNVDGDVVAISPDDGTVVRKFDTGAYELTGGLAYVNGELLGGDVAKRKIYRINPSTGVVLGSFVSPGSGSLTGLAGDGAAIAAAEIRGSVWNDVDGNRVWDDGDPGLEGWTVFLDDNENGIRDSEETFGVTRADGSYAIVDVLPGTHVVSVEMQPDWAQTCPGPNPSQGRLFALWADDETAVATIVELNPEDGTIINEFSAPGTVTRAGLQGLAAGPDRLYYIEGNSFALYELDLDTGAMIDSHVSRPDIRGIDLGTRLP